MLFDPEARDDDPGERLDPTRSDRRSHDPCPAIFWRGRIYGSLGEWFERIISDQAAGDRRPGIARITLG